MKIIFAPAKETTLANVFPKQLADSPTTQAIIQNLQNLTEAEVKALYKISDKQVDQVKNHIQTLDKAEGYPALSMYNGLAYRQISVDTEDSVQTTYLDKHLRILSALYGPIKPSAIIRPYRLDFNTPIKINGQNLRKLWGKSFNDSFEKGETILNLASQEFSIMLDQNRYYWIDFDFYEYDSSKTSHLKKHATISKKGRGKMVDFLAKNQISSLETVKQFNIDGYQFDENLSEDQHFVFVQY